METRTDQRLRSSHSMQNDNSGDVVVNQLYTVIIGYENSLLLLLLFILRFYVTVNRCSDIRFIHNFIYESLGALELWNRLNSPMCSVWTCYFTLVSETDVKEDKRFMSEDIVGSDIETLTAFCVHRLFIK